MLRYFLSRLFLSILLLFGVLTLAFFMLRVTGDPASLMMSREATPQEVQAFREAMGFDRPLGIQYWDFIRKAVVGNFGNSLHYSSPALPLVLDRLPATVELASVGLLMALAIGLPLGLAGGFNPGSVFDSSVVFWACWDRASQTSGLS